MHIQMAQSVFITDNSPPPPVHDSLLMICSFSSFPSELLHFFKPRFHSHNPHPAEKQMTTTKMSVVDAKKKIPELNAIVNNALARIKKPMLSANEALEQACTKAGMARVEFKEAIQVFLSARLGADAPDSNDDAELCYQMGKCLFRNGAELPTSKTWLALAIEMGFNDAKEMLERTIIPTGS